MTENTEQTGSPMFGITTETKSNNVAPIKVARQVENNPQFPDGWEFPIVNLVNVVATPEFEKKDGSKVGVLDFIFKDKEGRQHIHREWELETTDAKLQDKIGYMQVRIKHIFVTVFGGFPKEGLGQQAKNFKEFFVHIAEAFNNRVKTEGEGDDAKTYKVYPKTDMYLKLTYYKKNLGVPLSPDFLERVIPNKPCKVLTIHPVHDKLAPQGGGGSNIPGTGNSGINTASSDLPSFDDESFS